MTKKFFAAIFLSLVLCPLSLITGCGGGSEKSSAPAKDKVTIGVITHLNASEIEYNDWMQKLEKSYRPSKASLSANYKYFDTMNDMQLALESGQIDMLGTYQCVADYMLKNSTDKEILPSEKNLHDSFCFALRADETELKGKLNEAINSMTADGTLARLTKEYITDAADPKPVPIAKIDGAPTIKVAVTGDLPPFDMVLADGTPAGFSTAVLEEISKRIGENIELIDIDSNARASILTSHGADVVFWVSVPKDETLLPANIDAPKELTVTEPYFADEIVHVGMKK